VESADHHGELVVDVEDLNVLVVLSHNGDPEVQYVNLNTHNATLHHSGTSLSIDYYMYYNHTCYL